MEKVSFEPAYNTHSTEGGSTTIRNICVDDFYDTAAKRSVISRKVQLSYNPGHSAANRRETLLVENLPVQLYPSPKNPSRQVHVALPELLLQSARALHPPLFTAHASESMHHQT